MVIESVTVKKLNTRTTVEENMNIRKSFLLPGSNWS